MSWWNPEGGAFPNIPLPGGVFGQPSASVEGVPVAPGTAVETAIRIFQERHSQPPPTSDVAPPGQYGPITVGPAPSAPPSQTVTPAPAPPVFTEAPPPMPQPDNLPLPHFPHVDQINANVPPAVIWEAWHAMRERGDRVCGDDDECELLYGGGFVFPHDVHDDIYRGPPIPEQRGGADPNWTREQRIRERGRGITPFPPIGTDVPKSLQLVDGAWPGGAIIGPIAREIIRQVIRRIRVRPRPGRRPVRRRRVEEPPTWPRRPRRYGEPVPAPRRAPQPRIPRQTPSEPEWTSPYPQIEVPRVPTPRPIEVPRPVPQDAPPSRMPAPPVPPTPGGSPWPISPVPTFPAPQSAPGPVPGAGAPSPQTSSGRRRWPLTNPAALIAGAALSILLRDRSTDSDRLLWVSPAATPSPLPGASPSPLPSLPTTGAQPLPGLTPLNASALQFAQEPSARRCACPKCKTTKRGKRRKCRVRGNVIWQSGAKKGQLAGTKCQQFATR